MRKASSPQRKGAFLMLIITALLPLWIRNSKFFLNDSERNNKKSGIYDKVMIVSIPPDTIITFFKFNTVKPL